jgi:hypothetical protein
LRSATILSSASACTTVAPPRGKNMNN